MRLLLYFPESPGTSKPSPSHSDAYCLSSSAQVICQLSPWPAPGMVSPKRSIPMIFVMRTAPVSRLLYRPIQWPRLGAILTSSPRFNDITDCVTPSADPHWPQRGHRVLMQGLTVHSLR